MPVDQEAKRTPSGLAASRKKQKTDHIHPETIKVELVQAEESAEQSDVADEESEPVEVSSIYIEAIVSSNLDLFNAVVHELNHR
jgi:hypothetical protein